MIHISACSVKWKKGDKWTDCAAIVRSPGISEVITFIMPNGMPYPEEEVWTFYLRPFAGAISIPATED